MPLNEVVSVAGICVYDKPLSPDDPFTIETNFCSEQRSAGFVDCVNHSYIVLTAQGTVESIRERIYAEGRVVRVAKQAIDPRSVHIVKKALFGLVKRQLVWSED
jgi:hypothetical protein